MFAFIRRRQSREPFAAWLKATMQENDRDEQAMAAVLGVPERAVRRWATARSVPEVSDIRKLATHCRTPMAQLLVLAGHMTSEELGAWPPQKPGSIRTL